MTELQERLDLLLDRLRNSYDGIGHSSGRPFVYFVYPPGQERTVRRMADEQMNPGFGLRYHHIDLLPLTIESLNGQEERREALLNHPAKSAGAAGSIVGIWSRAVARRITEELSSNNADGRPVIVLRGLAALHPIGNPTALMEQMAEAEPRDPTSGRVVPIVILVPGTRPPQTSRTYRFLGLQNQEMSFYRGEEA